MTREDSKTGSDQTMHTDDGQDYRGRTRYDSNNKGSYRYNTRGNKRYGG